MLRMGNGVSQFLSVVFVNPNSWEGAKLALATLKDLGVSPDVLMVAETKLVPMQLVNAESWASQRGYRHQGTGAVSIAGGRSGGVSVLTHKGYAAGRLEEVEGAAGRFTATLASVGRVKVIFGALYLRPAVSIWDEECVDFLAGIARWLLLQNHAYVLGADWNASVQEVLDSGFPKLARGVLVASGQVTCTQSSEGSEIDFFLVSDVLRDFVHDIRVVDGMPFAPHKAVHLQLAGFKMKERVRVLDAPRGFSATMPIGCVQAFQGQQWQVHPGPRADGESDDGVVGNPVQEVPVFEAMWAEWIAVVEQRLCQVHGLGDPHGEAQAFCGRARGVNIFWKSVRQVIQDGKWKDETKLLRSARSVAGLIKRAVAMARDGMLETREFALVRLLLQRPMYRDTARDPHQWDVMLRCGSPDMLERLLASAQARVDSLQANYTKKRLQSWKDWVGDAISRGGRGAHRYMQQAYPSNQLKDAHGNMLTGMSAVKSLLHDWMPRWKQRESEPALPPMAAVTKRLAPISAARVDAVCSTYRQAVGLGWEVLHPQSVRHAGGDMVARLADILNAYEDQPVASQAFATKVVFQTKPDDDGVRPIGLSCTPMRVWSRIRAQDCKVWQFQVGSQSWSWGRRDRSCSKAGWVHALLADYAVAMGLETATLFTDLAKFYEEVSREVLIQESGMDAVCFPADLILGLATFYAGYRMVEFAGASSALFKVWGTILAGCSCATTCAQIMLFTLLSEVQESYTGQFLVNVVDDVSTMVCGTRRFVSATLARLGDQLFEGFRQRRLAVNFKKTVFIASSKGAAQDLGAHWSGRGIGEAREHRNLGTDAFGRGGQKARTSAKRAGKAKKKARRLYALRRAASGKQLHGLHRAGLSACALWGGSVRGIPPSTLHGLRVSAAKACGKLARGSSVALRLGLLRVRRWDPRTLHVRDVVFDWAESVFTGFPSARYLEVTLHEAKRKQRNWRSGFWKRGRGPADVLLWQLDSIGWSAVSATEFITHYGLHLDLMALSPAYLRDLAAEAASWSSDVVGLQRSLIEPSHLGPINWALVNQVGGKMRKRERASMHAAIIGPTWTQSDFVRHCIAEDVGCRL